MLELKNVYINLISDSRQIVENFSFALNRGDKAVIIGEEGNGKSTLLKYIYDEKLIGYCNAADSYQKRCAAKTMITPQKCYFTST